MRQMSCRRRGSGEGTEIGVEASLIFRAHLLFLHALLCQERLIRSVNGWVDNRDTVSDYEHEYIIVDSAQILPCYLLHFEYDPADDEKNKVCRTAAGWARGGKGGQ